MKPAEYIRGFAVLRVTGAEPEQYLTELSNRHIPFRCPDPPRDYTLHVRVPARYRKRAAAAAAACGCEAVVTSLHGTVKLLTLLKKRWPAALLLTAALFALLESQARIWDITVEGNETIPTGVILQEAEACGVTIGTRWLDLSQDGFRNELILRLPGLRWATVTMQGSRAHVIVREKWFHDPLVNEDDPSRIVAVKAGLITEVRALHGTASTEKGRAVLPGETLVEGCTTGRFGIQGAAWAAGTVRARTWYELAARAPSEIEVKTPTGEKTTRWSLILGKNRINFYLGSSICPEDCDKIIERYEADWEGVFLLPLALERTTVFGYVTERVPAEELREELEAQLTARLLGEIGEDGIVLSAVFTASETGGALTVTLRAECEEQIGALVPLTEAEIEEINARISRNLY